MPYRVSKSFRVESGHMLSKHPGRCRFPHGHSRRIDVVVAADALDSNDMVCDFKALKLAIEQVCDKLDHALAINSDDPLLANLTGVRERLVVLPGIDPTTEVLARRIYDELTALIGAGFSAHTPDGVRYTLPGALRVERVRVTETETTWAEFEPGA